jgi:hypothetical protein
MGGMKKPKSLQGEVHVESQNKNSKDIKRESPVWMYEPKKKPDTWCNLTPSNISFITDSQALTFVKLRPITF